jgi:PHD/YefM family antitoxin component YafN of YafNO toxin-antitoxin module
MKEDNVMATITANDIKRCGVTSIAKILENSQEAFISVRGKNKYVVMSVEQYRHMRECELEAALLEAREDRKAGRIAEKTIDQHIAGLKNG